MLRDKMIEQEILVKVCNGFLWRSHLPPSVGLVWLIPPTFAISYVSVFFFFCSLWKRTALELTRAGNAAPFIWLYPDSTCTLPPPVLLLNSSSYLVTV